MCAYNELTSKCMPFMPRAWNFASFVWLLAVPMLYVLFMCGNAKPHLWRISNLYSSSGHRLDSGSSYLPYSNGGYRDYGGRGSYSGYEYDDNSYGYGYGGYGDYSDADDYNGYGDYGDPDRTAPMSRVSYGEPDDGRVERSRRSKQSRSHGGPAYRVSRGIALFIGLFSLFNLVGLALGHGSNQNLWWIDPTFLSSWFGSWGTILGMAVQAAAGILLVCWAFSPACGRGRKVATKVFCILAALIALQNAFSYWQVLASGSLYWALPIPLSFFIFLLFIWLSRRVGRSAVGKRHEAGKKAYFGVIVFAVIAALVFPLAQIFFFGTTDYRTNADAAVVFGARVYDDGRLSLALRERMDTAIELYSQGYVGKLIVSGGIEEGTSISEAKAMFSYAQQQGMPSSDIIVDEYGSSTKETVDNTVAIAQSNGFGKLIATSSFYHMPRIKMLYMARGVNVYTVPTVGNVLSNRTGFALWREIPAWWYYWLTDTVGGSVG